MVFVIVEAKQSALRFKLRFNLLHRKSLKIFFLPSHHQQIFLVCCWACVVSLRLNFLKLTVLLILKQFFLTLDITGVCDLLIVRCGLCLASLLKIVNNVALEFSDDKIIFLFLRSRLKNLGRESFCQGTFLCL